MISMCRKTLFWVVAFVISMAELTCFAQRSGDEDNIVSGRYQEILEVAKQSVADKSLEVEGLELLHSMLDAPPPDRTRLYLPLPLRARRADTPRVELNPRLRQLLDAGAADLVKRSESLLAQGASAQAYRTLMQAAALDPKQKDAQKVLEATLESLLQRRITAQVNQPHPLTGWPAKSYSMIATPHFKIASQAPNRISDDLATFCEQTYCVWQQLFFDYWCEPSKLASRVQGKMVPLELPHEFNVVLFRDRDAYKNALKSVEANIDISTGYYNPKLKTAFFYFETDKSWPTIAHELTHQFFQEGGLHASKLDTDSQSDFWIVEGIAMYMESISRRYGIDCKVFDVGGWDSPRLQAARYRRLYDEFWIPWNELQRATGKSFREGKDVSLWYSHSAGLTHYWMDTDETRRQAILKYLIAVYQGQSTLTILPETSNDETLRGRYDRFITPTRGQIEARSVAPERQDIVLTRTDVDSSSLLKWPNPLRHCQWLDLSFTKIDDQMFLKAGEGPWDCVRLSLEGTKITNASLIAIASMPRLEELDLSHCAITDDGLKQLQRHPTLKSLWLTGTKVTDASLSVIESLPKAISVDIGQTEISPQEWQKTLRKMPRLKK